MLEKSVYVYVYIYTLCICILYVCARTARAAMLSSMACALTTTLSLQARRLVAKSGTWFHSDPSPSPPSSRLSSTCSFVTRGWRLGLNRGYIDIDIDVDVSYIW